jgi:acetyl-CoA synthetase
MQACARIGAAHSVIRWLLGQSLHERIIDAGAVAVITADEQARGGRHSPLKAIVDGRAAQPLRSGTNVIVYKRTAAHFVFGAARLDARPRRQQPDTCERNGSARSTLFSFCIRPARPARRGVRTAPPVTCCGHAFMRWTFDIKPKDVFWCTADIGWVLGHTITCQSARRQTSKSCSGHTDVPRFRTLRQTINKHKVSIFYTAPTAIAR